MAKLQRLQCPKCGNWFNQNSYNHAHCTVCAAQVAIEKNVAKCRAKRERLKAEKEAQHNA